MHKRRTKSGMKLAFTRGFLAKRNNKDFPILAIQNLKRYYGQTIKKSKWLCKFMGLPFTFIWSQTRLNYYWGFSLFFFFFWQKRVLLSWWYKKYLIWLYFLKIKDKKDYKAFCHRKGYPLNGQRTHSNAKTVKILHLHYLKLPFYKNKKYLFFKI